jgi:Replication protein
VQATAPEQPAKPAGRSPNGGDGGVPWDVANNSGSAAAGDPAVSRRRDAWAALDWLHRGSSIDRVRACRRFPVGDREHVAVKKRGGRAHYSGLQTCGSVWSCPCCSEKILAERADELAAAIERWHADGGKVAMVTLTMRHDRGQELAELWDALSSAWAAAVGGNRAARRALKHAEVKHWVRRVEATHGANGWHVHVHALLFLPAAADQHAVDELGRVMFDAWARRLTTRGLAAPLRDSGGLDARLLSLDQAREDVAGYLAKGTYEAVAPAAAGGDEQARRAARELAGASGKRGRGGNRSTMQLLADLVAFGLADDFARWREWEAASTGRRAITWSRGARRALLAGRDERSDEEIAADTDGAGEVVALLPLATWARIRATPGLAPRLLEHAEVYDTAEDTFDLLCRWLTKRGLPAPMRPG